MTTALGTRSTVLEALSPLCAFSGAPLAEVPSLISTPVGPSPASSDQWVGAETGRSLSHPISIEGGFSELCQLSHPRSTPHVPQQAADPSAWQRAHLEAGRHGYAAQTPHPYGQNSRGSPLSICTSNALAVLLPSQDSQMDIFLISCSSQPVCEFFITRMEMFGVLLLCFTSGPT